MSYADISPYFRTQIAKAGPFKEVPKPFDQSIGSTIIDRSYSIVFDRISGTNRNMIDFQSVASIVIYLYRKGYASESAAREGSVLDAEKILKACMTVGNANTQSSIKNVTMRTVDVTPLPGNDNTVECKIIFDVSLRFIP